MLIRCFTYPARKLLNVAEDPQHLSHMKHYDMHVGSDMLSLVPLHHIP